MTNTTPKDEREKLRDKLANEHYYEFVQQDEDNKCSLNWLAPRFSAFCYGWDACEKIKATLDHDLAVMASKHGKELLECHEIYSKQITALQLELKEKTEALEKCARATKREANGEYTLSRLDIATFAIEALKK
jgi:hypothetical protein